VPLDVIWLRFKLSESEYFDYEKRTKKEQSAPVQLVLADGQLYPHEGQIQNTVNQVDSRTGTIELQATFPNPEHIVLPGQFGRVRMRTESRKNAILVPQKAVQEVQGLQSLLTVTPDNKVRPYDRDGEQSERSVVLQGLKSGERVIGRDSEGDSGERCPTLGHQTAPFVARGGLRPPRMFQF
jgi:membrane fusion protein (multidrug efflux system)